LVLHFIDCHNDERTNIHQSNPVTGPAWPRGWVEIYLYSSMTSALEGVSGQQHASAALYPREKTRYPKCRRLGGPVGWSGGAKNLLPTGIRSPDRPARSSVAIPTELPGPPKHFVPVRKCRQRHNLTQRLPVLTITIRNLSITEHFPVLFYPTHQQLAATLSVQSKYLEIRLPGDIHLQNTLM
jgi:hypothetical protein